jgi:chromosome segregation ATPase
MYPKTGELSIKELRSAIPITEAENDDIYDISSKSNNEDPEIALDSNGLIISSSNNPNMLQGSQNSNNYNPLTYSNNSNMMNKDLMNTQNSLNNKNDYISSNQKDIIERLNFQLELANQKIKNNERTIDRLTSIQHEYELKFSTLTSEYRAKEQTLREKYKAKEENLYTEQKQNELEYERQIGDLKSEIKQLKDIIFNNDKEINNYKTKTFSIDSNMKIREKEFQAAIDMKDHQIRELEDKIVQIDEENNLKLEEMSNKNKELLKQLADLRTENTLLSNNIKNNQNYLNYSQNQLKNNSSNNSLIINSPTNNAILAARNAVIDANNSLHYLQTSSDKNNHPALMTAYDIMKIKELREQVQKLQNETVQLTRELSLKYDECDTLSEEIERLKNIIKTNQIQNNNLNMNISMMMNQTNYDNNKDNLKLNNLEMLVNNYGQTLMAIKQQHENQMIEHQKELNDITMDYENKLQNLVKENNELKRKVNISLMTPNVDIGNDEELKYNLMNNPKNINDLNDRYSILKQKISEI